MALRVSAVREAMAHVLDVAMGAEVQIATAPDQLTPPCILIGMPSVEYHAAFRRSVDQMEMPVYVVLPRVHDQTAVDLADEMISGIGARSLVAILHADQTLGGACQTLVVRSSISEFYQITGDQPAYRFTVEVWG